ncbi:histidine kinase dimerization/phosphoacceptor domain-containing protein [Fodinicola feengrottensis]
MAAQASTRPAWLRLPTWQSRSDARWEIGLATGLLLVGVLVMVVGLLPWDGRLTSPWQWIAVGLQVPASLVLLWRRRYPVTVSSILLLVVLLAVIANPSGATFSVPLQIDAWLPLAASMTANTVIHFGERSRRGRYVWGLLAVITLVAARPWDLSLSVLYGGVSLAAVPALLGAYLAARARLLREATDRAERAERDRALAAGQARAQERMRLAADLHDVVTHRISLMVLQAGAVRMSTVDPTIRSAAEDLRTVGCEALEELRDMIGVLRIDHEEAT